MNKPVAKQDPAASKRISARISGLGDWRVETLERVRALIKEADPGRGRGAQMGEAHQPRNSHLVARRDHLYR